MTRVGREDVIIHSGVDEINEELVQEKGLKIRRILRD